MTVTGTKSFSNNTLHKHYRSAVNRESDYGYAHNVTVGECQIQNRETTATVTVDDNCSPSANVAIGTTNPSGYNLHANGSSFVMGAG
jgi:hypothetical protein